MLARHASLPAALVAILGASLLVAGCAKPSTSDTGTGGTTGAGSAGTTGASCSTGQTKCSQGCTNVNTDSANCGACGTVCKSGQTCQSGACACGAGLLNCGGSCVSSNNANCGSCGTTCTSTQVCSNNTCSSSCASGTTACSGGTCANTMTDSLNCGACGTVCSGGTTCTGGTCTCSVSGQQVCNGTCIDTASNTSNCGSCGHACTSGQSCTNSVCTGGAGTAGTNGGTAGTSGGTAGTTGTTGTAGTTGKGGSTGTGGAAGNPPGWWTAGTWHGCPWTGIDTLAGSTTTNTPQDFVTKASPSTPYCVSGKVTADPGYNGVALLGFNLDETPTGSSTQCAYKAADPTAIGPTEITVTGTGIAVSFTKTIGSVLRIQIQGANGGMNNTTGQNDRWCYTIADVQGPIFAPFSKFNTKCWDMSGTAFNPSTNHIDAIVFGVPGNTIPTPFSYCIGGFATGNDVSAAPAYTPSPYPTVSGTIGGPGVTDLDFQRVKVAAPGVGGAQYIVQNNNWGTPASTDQTITYSANSFTVVSTTGNVTGAGVPASFPSIYIGGNGDTQSANDPPKGSYTTHPGDHLPKQISAIGTLMSTFAYNKSGGDYNATYDIWLASGNPTSAYSDALSGFVMVWLYQPSGRQPIGTMVKTVTIGGNSYNVWAGPRNSGTLATRPVISYVLASSKLSQTFDIKPILADAATVSGSGFTQISTSWYVTDIFAGFEIWTGSSAAGLSVTNFTADVE